MKRPLFVLLLATLSCFAAGYAAPSETAADAVNNMSAIKRPTPPPANTAVAANTPLEASLSANEKGKSSAPSVANFPSTTQKVYVNFSYGGATKGQKVTVTWIAEDAKDLKKNKVLNSNTATLTGPGATGSYYLEGKGLPAGKYRVDIAEDGKVAKSLKFAVK